MYVICDLCLQIEQLKLNRPVAYDLQTLRLRGILEWRNEVTSSLNRLASSSPTEVMMLLSSHHTLSDNSVLCADPAFTGHPRVAQ